MNSSAGTTLSRWTCSAVQTCALGVGKEIRAGRRIVRDIYISKHISGHDIDHTHSPIAIVSPSPRQRLISIRTTERSGTAAASLLAVTTTSTLTDTGTPLTSSVRKPTEKNFSSDAADDAICPHRILKRRRATPSPQPVGSITVRWRENPARNEAGSDHPPNTHSSLALATEHAGAGRWWRRERLSWQDNRRDM